MGRHVNRRLTRILGYGLASALTALNAYLIALSLLG
jgi:hypothetical protein